MFYQIRNRWTNLAQWEGEIEATADTAVGVKLGRAVRAAVKARADLRGVSLIGARLTGVNLAGVNLAGADLTGACLQYANLATACLMGADLMGADLTGTCLPGANLADTNLIDADLTEAHLVGANFAGADLGKRRFVVSGGFDRRGHSFMTLVDGDSLLISAGCRRWTSFDAARAHYGDNYSGKGDRAECLARIALMEDQVEARRKMGGGDAE